MDPLEELAAVRFEGGSVLTLGVFDGVHRGHRYLIDRLKDEARRRDLTSAVITFMNHPRTVLQPDSETTYISPVTQRIDLLDSTGVGRVVPCQFTPELSKLTYQEFATMLKRRLGMRGLVVGPDFAMGKDRGGNTQTLTEFGRESGFIVHIVNPLREHAEVVSTTEVRRCLLDGDMNRAEVLLGRPHSLIGSIIAGDRRGRTLGFPTANLLVGQEIALPVDGIYCTVAHVEDKRHPSVTSIGVRPTFGELGRTIETFIIDFDGDLYGKSMKIEVLQRIREEIRFSDVDALVNQMKSDVLRAREFFAARGIG